MGTTGPLPRVQVIETAQIEMERWEVREELGAPASSLPSYPLYSPPCSFLSCFYCFFHCYFKLSCRSPATEFTAAESIVQWVAVRPRGGHRSLIPGPFVTPIRRPVPRQWGLASPLTRDPQSACLPTLSPQDGFVTASIQLSQ